MDYHDFEAWSLPVNNEVGHKKQRAEAEKSCCTKSRSRYNEVVTQNHASTAKLVAVKRTENTKTVRQKAQTMKAVSTGSKTFSEGTMTHIPLKFIVEHPEIIYRDLNDEWVEELSRNIEAVGLTVPLLVWNGGGEKGQRMQIGEGDGAEKVAASFLVAGNHRRAALKSLFKRNAARFKELFPSGVPCVVLGGEMKDVLTAQLRENVMREEMSPEQVFPVLKRLLKKEEKGGCGMSQKEVAKEIGKSQGWVSQILDIEEQLGEEAVEALKKKELGLAETRQIASKVKKAKKKGEAVDPKEELAKAKAKKKALKESGKSREPKRFTAKKLWDRYTALPRMSMGEAKAILEAALAYLAGDDNAELPDELKADAEEEGDDSEE